MSTRRAFLKSITALNVASHLPPPPLPPSGLPAELVAGFPRLILHSADQIPPARIQSITSNVIAFASPLCDDFDFLPWGRTKDGRLGVVIPDADC